MPESESGALPLGDTPVIYNLVLFGEPRGIRTPGTRIRSPLLYPTEL